MDAGVTREKLTANVSFPLKGLKLSAYASDECNRDDGAAEYATPKSVQCRGSLACGCPVHHVCPVCLLSNSTPAPGAPSTLDIQPLSSLHFLNPALLQV